MTLEQRLRELYSLQRNERAYLQGIETKYAAQQEQLRQLEQQREEARQRLAQVQTKEKSIILEEVRKSADLLQQRSQLYAHLPAEMRNEELQHSDARIMKLYGENRDDPRIAQFLEKPYQEALQRQGQRLQQQKEFAEVFPAGVVICPQEKEQEKELELYVTVPFAQQNEGLMRNLIEVVGNALLSRNMLLLQDREEQGILILTVQGEAAALVESLSRQQPAGFADAQIQYQVLLVKEPAEERGIEPPLETTVSETTRGHPLEEVFDRSYVQIQLTEAFTGLNSCSLHKHLDTNDGPIKSKKKKGRRYVEVVSLLNFLKENYGEPRLYTLEEAAVEWKTRARELLEREINLPASLKSLQEECSSQEAVFLPGKQGQKYLSNFELHRLAINYFSLEVLAACQGPIPREKLTKILSVQKGYIPALVRTGKLQYGDENGETVDIASAREFRAARFYDGEHWQLREHHTHRKP